MENINYMMLLLPKELNQKLKHLARVRGTNKNRIVLEALEFYFKNLENQKREEEVDIFE